MRRAKRNIFYKALLFKQALDIWKEVVKLECRDKKVISREEYRARVAPLNNIFMKLKRELKNII